MVKKGKRKNHMNPIRKASRILFVLTLALTCQGCVGRMFYQPDRIVYDTPDRHGLMYRG